MAVLHRRGVRTRVLYFSPQHHTERIERLGVWLLPHGHSNRVMVETNRPAARRLPYRGVLDIIPDDSRRVWKDALLWWISTHAAEVYRPLGGMPIRNDSATLSHAYAAYLDLIGSAAHSRLLLTFMADTSKMHFRPNSIAGTLVAGLFCFCLCLQCSCGRSERAEAGTRHSTKPATSPAPWSEDMNNDGLPDSIELHKIEDRQNFQAWFTDIAEMQFYRMSDAWNPDQRDCAGLVRFAIREALRTHDHAWFQKMGAGYQTVAPDVKAVKLDSNPVGEKLFRTDYGSFKVSDLTDGKLSEYADGRTLKNYNCEFVSRDRSQAKPGDLLFFFQPWVQKYPYHVMIFVGSAHVEPGEGNDWVVYHTGSSPTDAGTVKKVRLSVLDHHPDKRWRPVETNPNFLGFYRLKMLG